MVSESNSSLCFVTQELRLMDDMLNVSVKLLNQSKNYGHHPGHGQLSLWCYKGRSVNSWLT